MLPRFELLFLYPSPLHPFCFVLLQCAPFPVLIRPYTQRAMTTEHWDFTGNCPRLWHTEGKQVTTWVHYCPWVVLPARIWGNWIGYPLSVPNTASFQRALSPLEAWGEHAVPIADMWVIALRFRACLPLCIIKRASKLSLHFWWCWSTSKRAAMDEPMTKQVHFWRDCGWG